MKSPIVFILFIALVSIYILSTRPTASEVIMLTKKAMIQESKKEENKEQKIKETIRRRTAIIIRAGMAGSGTVVSADGHIVSALHVVGNHSDPSLRIKLDDRIIEANDIKIIDFNEEADMTLLKVSGPTLDFSPIVDPQTIFELEQGNKLWLAGNSYGQGFVYITRAIFFQNTLNDRHTLCIGTEGFNSPGTSGGGLYTELGGYIGMYHGITGTEKFSAVGLSIHGAIIRAILEKNNIPFTTFMSYK